MSSPVAIPFHMMKQTTRKGRTSRPKAMNKMTHRTIYIPLRNSKDDWRSIRFQNHMREVQLLGQKNSLFQSKALGPFCREMRGQSLTMGSNYRAQLIADDHSNTRDAAAINRASTIHVNFSKTHRRSSPAEKRGLPGGKIIRGS